MFAANPVLILLVCFLLELVLVQMLHRFALEKLHEAGQIARLNWFPIWRIRCGTDIKCRTRQQWTMWLGAGLELDDLQRIFRRERAASNITWVKFLYGLLWNKPTKFEQGERADCFFNLEGHLCFFFVWQCFFFNSAAFLLLCFSAAFLVLLLFHFFFAFRLYGLPAMTFDRVATMSPADAHWEPATTHERMVQVDSNSIDSRETCWRRCANVPHRLLNPNVANKCIGGANKYPAQSKVSPREWWEDHAKLRDLWNAANTLQNERCSLQNAATPMRNGRCYLQNAANTLQHEQCHLQNVANTMRNVTNSSTQPN